MKSTGRAWNDIVAQYFAEYLDVMDKLHCTSVDVYAFATDYIDEIVEQIQGLIGRGTPTSPRTRACYFDTTTFSAWGKLSGQRVEELRPGARSKSRSENVIRGLRPLEGAETGGAGLGQPMGKGRPDGTSRTRPSRFGISAAIRPPWRAIELSFPHTKRRLPRRSRTPAWCLS